MQRHLYFVCPTDYLETVIDNAFKQENYYCTSLGNSIVFDTNRVGQLVELLEKKEINYISFILSNDNSIVLDALGNQNFSTITGLNLLYDQILQQKKYSELAWQIYDRQFLLLSYHLNSKIRELQLELNHLTLDPVVITGKIYNKQKNTFHEIFPDIICGEYFSLN